VVRTSYGRRSDDPRHAGMSCLPSFS
jgi:hypothetical protein